MAAVAPTLRSIFPQHPGRWLLTRVSFYVLMALIAAGGFFIFAPLFGGEITEGSYPLRPLSSVLALSVLSAVGYWLALSMMPRHAAISDLEEAINRLGRPPSLNYLVHADSKDSGTIWATIARRVQELEAERDLLQKQKEWQRQDLERVATLLGQLTSRAAMTQVLVEALRGSKWTMDEQELANIVSRAMAEMNKIAAQRPQQAVDRPSPFTPVP